MHIPRQLQEPKMRLGGENEPKDCMGGGRGTLLLHIPNGM
jgi:hypothetical protein